MKRRVFALVSLLILMLTMTAHAIEPYGAVQMPIQCSQGESLGCIDGPQGLICAIRLSLKITWGGTSI